MREARQRSKETGGERSERKVRVEGEREREKLLKKNLKLLVMVGVPTAFTVQV